MTMTSTVEGVDQENLGTWAEALAERKVPLRILLTGKPNQTNNGEPVDPMRTRRYKSQADL